MDKLKETIKLFKQLPQEDKENVVEDAKGDIKNHKLLGNNILHIVDYQTVPVKQLITNLTALLNEVTDKISGHKIDNIMEAVVLGNLDNATETHGLKHDTDKDKRNKIVNASHQALNKLNIDFGFGDSSNPSSWRNRGWIEGNKGLTAPTLRKYIEAILTCLKSL